MEHKRFKTEKMSKNKQRPRMQYQDEDSDLRDPGAQYSRHEKHKKVQYRDWWNEDLDVE